MRPSKPWRGRRYGLGKMTLDELWAAYFAYPAIQLYLVLAIACVVASGCGRMADLRPGLAVAATIAVYPFAWVSSTVSSCTAARCTAHGIDRGVVEAHPL